MVTRLEVVQEAREWLGTPYVHQHRDKGVAVDCIGLPIGVSRRLGLVKPDFDINGYGPRPTGNSFTDEADKYMARVPLQKMQIGDVVVFSFGEDPCHFGIVTPYSAAGHFGVIHAFSDGLKRGGVVEHRLMKTATLTPLFGYLLPGLES